MGSITLHVTEMADVAGGPYIADLSGYTCNELARRIDEEWAATH